jgi:ubiquinone/menaquinone biosynthesis C-methylase UbiE
MNEERYFTSIAAAYLAGRAGNKLTPSMPPEQQKSLVEAATAYVRPLLDKFKRKSVLPRVSKAIGFLRGVAPSSLLDVGFGRGTFLWPCMEAFPGIKITGIDIDPSRVKDLDCISKGGLQQVAGVHADVTDMPFEDRSFDVATALEVLEHVPDYGEAMRELKRVARRFVAMSVPTKEDDNPLHLRVIKKEMFEEHFDRLNYSFVRGHMLAFANVGE